MSDEFIQRIRSVIANSQKLPIDKVTLDSSFQDLGIDSMDAVNILFGLESEFGYFLLSELEEVRSPLGLEVERDLSFREGRLTDVVPAPD